MKEHSKVDDADDPAVPSMEDYRAFLTRVPGRDRCTIRKLRVGSDSASVDCTYVKEEMIAQLAIQFDHFLTPVGATGSPRTANVYAYAHDMRQCLDHSIPKVDAKFASVFLHACEIAIHELVAEAISNLNGDLSLHFESPKDIVHEVLDRATQTQKRRLRVHRGRPVGPTQFLGKDHACVCLFRAAQIGVIARGKVTQQILVDVLKAATSEDLGRYRWVNVPSINDPIRLRQIMVEYEIEWSQVKGWVKSVPEWVRNDERIKALVDEFSKKWSMSSAKKAT